MEERGLLRQHADRLHLRPRRLPGRPLAGREGPVPRALGEDPADRLRSVAGGRRDPRHASATRWSRPSTWRRPSWRRWAPIPPQQSHRLEGRSLVPFLAGKPPAEWRRCVFSEYDYSMLPVAAKLGVEPRDARLFMVARRALEVRARAGLPAHALRPGDGPAGARRSRRRPGLRRRAPAAGGRAGRVGPAALAAHHPLRRRRSRRRAASRCARASWSACGTRASFPRSCGAPTGEARPV